MTTTSTTPLRIDIPDEDWEAIGELGDERARILYRPGVTINGTGFHLEGWAVTTHEEHDGYTSQMADQDDDALGDVHSGVGADGNWETVTINGRDYVLVMSPYC